MAQKVATMLFVISLLFPGLSQADLRDKPSDILGTMSGQVYVGNKALPGAIIAFFNINKGLPPVGSGAARLPDFVDRADGDGKFKSKLPAGQYYMGILPRGADESTGPPKQGEKLYFANDGKRRLRKLSIENRHVVDVGRVDGIRRPEIVMDEDHGDFFTVKGTIVDGDSNRPYPGARVLAKKKTNHGKPDFFSPPTGFDGKFSIKLPVGDPLFLIARVEITGHKPGPGDKVGTYGLNSPAGASSKILSRVNKSTTPEGVSEILDISNTDTGLAVSGTKGQVLSGLIIRLYGIPDHNKEGQENLFKQSGLMFEDGVD